jgi:hypothetical protein
LRELAYLLDLDANGTRVRQHGLASGSEKNPSGSAPHELHADGFFEIRDGATDRNFRDLVGARCGGESR